MLKGAEPVLSKKKTRKALKIALCLMCVTLIVMLWYMFSVFRSMQAALDTAYRPVTLVREVNLEPMALSVAEEEEEEVVLEPLSFLLLGIDQDSPTERGRSDSMMLVTVNPDEGSTQILSLARDTKVDIIGFGTRDKLSHAYAFGGAQMSIDTVQHLLDIPIDFFVEINMEGFMDLVDIVGGVTVYNDFDFTQDNFVFPAGELHLTNSREVLAYVRMRKQDPNGDFGRQARQRDVLVALVEELTKSALFNPTAIFEILGENMGTNLTMDAILSLTTNYLPALERIEQFELRGTGQRIDGIFYQILSYEELSEMRSKVQRHLLLLDDVELLEEINLGEEAYFDEETYESEGSLLLDVGPLTGDR